MNGTNNQDTNVAEGAKVNKKHKKVAGLEKKKTVAGYCFIAPFILGFLIFMVRPFNAVKRL